MEERLDLAVVESRWWDDTNDSVRGLFDMLAGVNAENPYAYHYEMFVSAESLEKIIERIASSSDLFNVYVGAHGNETEIHLPGDERISRTQLRNMLATIEHKKLRGLFLGCCGFGNQVKFLASRTNMTWIAGYTERIDWIHSSAMDLYFWNAYYQSSVPEYVGSKKGLAERMEVLLGALRSRIPYLFSELGFRVAISRVAGTCKVFPDDWSETDLGHLKVVTDDYVKNNPGKWP